MSFAEKENCNLTSKNMEQEDTVKIEETSINLGYVKKELNEEELDFEEKQSKIELTLENVFGECSTEQRSNRNNFIGLLDDNVIMETGSVKLEDVKEENEDLVQKTTEQYSNITEDEREITNGPSIKSCSRKVPSLSPRERPNVTTPRSKKKKTEVRQFKDVGEELLSLYKNNVQQSRRNRDLDNRKLELERKKTELEITKLELERRKLEFEIAKFKYENPTVKFN